MEPTNTSPENQSQENEEQKVEQKDKAALIKKILFAAIGVLVLFLIILILIFVFKESAPKEPIKDSVTPVENGIEKNNETAQEEQPHNDFKFDFNNLDPEKLNEQLALLTNKNLELQKTQELDSLKEEKKADPVFNIVNNQKIAEEQALKIKDEAKDVETKKDIEQTPQEEIKSQEQKTDLVKTDTKDDELKVEQQNSSTQATKTDTKPTQISQEKENTLVAKENFVKLINVARIKGNLNKKYLDKAVILDPNILLCRDDNNIIELYYGPFLEESLRDELLSKLLNNGFKEAYNLEMLKDEFDKRCNY